MSESTPHPGRLLIATVGGTPEPIAHSLIHWKPVRVIFIVSPEVRSSIETDIALHVRESGRRDFDDGRYELREIPDAQNYRGITEAMRRLDEDVVKWLNSRNNAEIIVDFTGGTKAMSAGLAAAATRWPCTMSYVGGIERSKDNKGVVETGKERIFHDSNPWNSLGFLVIEQAVTLFNHGDYPAAMSLLETTHSQIEHPVRKSEFLALLSLCRLCDRWDSFHHSKALKSLYELQKSENNLIAALRGYRHDELRQWIHVADQRLREIVDSGQDSAPDRRLVYDLLANARRRIDSGRFDDAVSRLYRAIEALAQAELYERHSINTSKVALDRVPEPLRSRWEPRSSDGFVSIGLQDDYALLDALGNELGRKFKDNEALHSGLLSTRNTSILAHGFRPIDKKPAQQLFTHALNLAGIKEGDLIRFPILAPA